MPGRPAPRADVGQALAAHVGRDSQRIEQMTA